MDGSVHTKKIQKSRKKMTETLKNEFIQLINDKPNSTEGVSMMSKVFVITENEDIPDSASIAAAEAAEEAAAKPKRPVRNDYVRAEETLFALDKVAEAGIQKNDPTYNDHIKQYKNLYKVQLKEVKLEYERRKAADIEKYEAILADFKRDHSDLEEEYQAGLKKKKKRGSSETTGVVDNTVSGKLKTFANRIADVKIAFQSNIHMIEVLHTDLDMFAEKIKGKSGSKSTTAAATTEEVAPKKKATTETIVVLDEDSDHAKENGKKKRRHREEKKKKVVESESSSSSSSSSSDDDSSGDDDEEEEDVLKKSSKSSKKKSKKKKSRHH